MAITLSAKPARLRGSSLAALLGAAGLGLSSLAVLPQPAQAQGFDINSVFYCNEGEPTGTQSPEECQESRGLILANCTICHAFVIIVKQQKDAATWDSFLQAHHARVPELSDEQIKMMGDFLKAHFNPENPVPQLPPELEGLADMPPA